MMREQLSKLCIPGWLRRQLVRRDEKQSALRSVYQARLLASYLERDVSVIDIGCGHGLLASHLRQAAGCRVIGLDIEDTRTVDVELLRFDGAHIPLPAGSVDYAVLSFVLHHSQDPAALSAEVLHIVRQGVFIFEDVPVTAAQRMLVAAHIAVFSWMYNLALPTRQPWTCTYLRSVERLQLTMNVTTITLPKGRFWHLYPVSRRLYICSLLQYQDHAC